MKKTIVVKIAKRINEPEILDPFLPKPRVKGSKNTQYP
jgi:hypothetical protein